MQVVLLVFVLIFLVVGIVKSEQDRMKNVGISLSILSIINAIALTEHQPVNNEYLVLFTISPNQVDIIINVSLSLALVGLLIYVFSQKR